MVTKRENGSNINLRRYGRYLGKSMWRYKNVTDRLIRTIFGSPVQNNTPMAMKSSK